MFGKLPRRKLFSVFSAVLTVGAMALFFSCYDPWQPTGPEQVQYGGFESPACKGEWMGWSAWARRIENGGWQQSAGVILTTSSNRQGILRFTARDLENTPAFRVRLRAKASGMRQGTAGHHVPRAVFLYDSKEGRSLYEHSHGVVNFEEDRDWKHYSEVFPVPEEAASARLHLQNLGREGLLQIDDVSIVPVRARPSAPWWKLFFGTLWTAAFGACLFALSPWKYRIAGLLATVTVFVILFGIVMPEDTLDSTIRYVHSFQPAPAYEPSARTATVTPEPEKSQPARPEKTVEREVAEAHETGHFALFSLLAALCSIVWLRSPLLQHTAFVFAGLIGFAASTEVLQFITPDREADWGDLFTDVSGIVPAVIAVLIIRAVQIRMRKEP